LNATVTADLNIRGLRVVVNQMSVTYDASQDSFTLDGGASVSFSGVPKTSGTLVKVGTLGPLPTGFSGGATISEYATTIDYRLDSGQAFPTAVPFVIKIDDEQMEVVAVSPQYLIVERGYNKTTPQTHKVEAAGQTVADIYIYSAALTAPPNSATLSADFGDIAG